MMRMELELSTNVLTLVGFPLGTVEWTKTSETRTKFVYQR